MPDSARLQATEQRNTHQVTFDSPEHGHITVEPSNAAAGDTVTVTVITDSGYAFKGWESNSSAVEFENEGAATTTFVMPDDDVHISALIESTATEPPTTEPPVTETPATEEPTTEPQATETPDETDAPATETQACN